MNDDLPQPIPSAIYGEETPENRRIIEITDELTRRCGVYETQLASSASYGSRLECEQRIAEAYAKEEGLWLPFSKIGTLGLPGPSGNENDLYVAEGKVFKVNNLVNAGSIISLLHKIILHNRLFYDTAYQFFAFTGFDGRSVMPIFQQALVKDARSATPIEIDTYMAALGFEKITEGRYRTLAYEVWDLFPRNVLRDSNGDLFVIDAEIKAL